MMVHHSTCSTLAILIAFSRCPSIPSCVVTATGADFSAILRLVFAAKALGNAAHSSASGTASAAALFARCCPLPLGADDAVFMSSLFLRFGSGSIGFSLDSCDVDAANVGTGAADVTVRFFSFLWSHLCISSANVSLITSLLRSNLSAPCEVILRHSSIRTLQRSEWACALLLSLMALQLGHPTVAPNDSVCCLVILFPLDSCNCKGNGGIGIGSTQNSGQSAVHPPSLILQGTTNTFLTASLSHLLCGSNLLISRALNTPSAFPMKRSAQLLRIQAKFWTCIWDSLSSWDLW